MELGELGRVLVASGGATLVLLAAILVICCLAPSCCLHRCCRRRKNSGGAVSPELLKDPSARRRALYGDEVVLAEFPHGVPVHTKEMQTQVEMRTAAVPCTKRLSGGSIISACSSQTSGVSSGRSSALRDSIYSACSWDGDSEQVLTNGSSKQDSAVTDSPQPQPQATLTFALTTLMPGSEVTEPQPNRLSITLNEASDLPTRRYCSGAVDAYAEMQLRRASSSGSPASPPLLIVESRTRTIRRASQPAFQHTLTTDLRAPHNDLKELSLEVNMYDEDRFGNPTHLCQGTVSLSSLKDLHAKHLQTYKLAMKPSSKIQGEILLSASFLPTAQRVAFSVLRVQGISCPGIATINPYVRIIMLTSMGRSLKRKKTGYKVATNCPSFADTLSFDVTPGQLENLTFLVTVCHRATDTPQESGSSGSEQDGSLQGQQHQVEQQDRCLGKVALGSGVRGASQRLHWLSVLAAPRRVITHWHPLH